MIREKVILITGANGEVGHGLIRRLYDLPSAPPVVVLDINELDRTVSGYVREAITGDILDDGLLNRLAEQYEIDAIYHLAALLSTSAERQPERAHRVNVEGTMNLLRLASAEAGQRGEPVKFIFPSSIAVYGMADIAEKHAAPPISEDQHLNPITMYGCNKLYCEHVGRYYSQHYRQLATDGRGAGVDFRALRFPGLISALTTPSGGTSDYAPEIIHAAAAGEAHSAFVRPDTTIPFMMMPDAVDALLALADVRRERLTRTVYNVSAFSLSAEQIAERVRVHFPSARIDYAPDAGRQRVVDSWPARLDDRRARQDWGWSPVYDAERAFSDYLIPMITARYQSGSA
ncbi:MAG: NAD-dependent epimerase/dehydratase family protein [Anaerolineaceae bacterium]|nr:MAG: NAD-dependent epimerase/dehydratase family protein [Anaerolineaceae bacterium]